MKFASRDSGTQCSGFYSNARKSYTDKAYRKMLKNDLVKVDITHACGKFRLLRNRHCQRQRLLKTVDQRSHDNDPPLNEHFLHALIQFSGGISYDNNIGSVNNMPDKDSSVGTGCVWRVLAVTPWMSPVV